MKFLSNFRNRVRHFFFSRYVRFVEFVTLYMIARTGKLVRNLLVLKGKNPDYVAPPPPPPPPPAPKPDYIIREEAITAKRAELISRFTSCGGPNNNQWVKDPSTHPVIKSRMDLAARAAKAKADKEARLAAIIMNPESAETLPSLEVVMSETLDEAQVVDTAASVEEKEAVEGEKDLG